MALHAKITMLTNGLKQVKSIKLSDNCSSVYMIDLTVDCGATQALFDRLSNFSDEKKGQYKVLVAMGAVDGRFIFIEELICGDSIIHFIDGSLETTYELDMI